MIYKKRKKKWEKDNGFFICTRNTIRSGSKWNPVDSHQHRFIGTIVVDIDISTAVPHKTVADT
jgi:hypothetical protein